jgi:hypothetical protein
MKNIGILCLLLTCIGLASCKNEKKQETKDANEIQAEKPVSTECYQSIYEKDTVQFTMNTLKSGKISGKMVMKIENKPKKEGDIVGEFRGDTLFGAYTFFQGTNEKVTFKNPMAFLKKGNELILGNGQIEYNMGVSYFVKGKPIDFEKVKYKFTKVDCVEK